MMGSTTSGVSDRGQGVEGANRFPDVPSVLLVESAKDDRAMYAEYLRLFGLHTIEIGDTGDAHALGMTAHVVYTAIDPIAPATTSVTLVRDVIRGSLGFAGLLMSDDISMGALSGSLAGRSQAAIAAGCDLVLHCNGTLDEMEEVAGAVPVLEERAAIRAESALARRRAPGTGCA